jgi:hypothetical protein
MMLTLSLEQARASQTWTADHVRARLIEAFTTERKLPGEHFMRRIASAWPATPIYDFVDKVSWTDTRQRVWDSWEHAKGAYPIEVSRMEEAFDWLEWLPLLDRRCLSGWAAASVSGYPLRKLLRQFDVSRATFYRTRDDDAARIAVRIHAQGVVGRL